MLETIILFLALASLVVFIVEQRFGYNHYLLDMVKPEGALLTAKFASVLSLISLSYVAVVTMRFGALLEHAKSLQRVFKSSDDKVSEAGAVEASILHDQLLKEVEFTESAVCGDHLRTRGHFSRSRRADFVFAMLCGAFTMVAVWVGGEVLWWQPFPVLTLMIFRAVTYDLSDSGCLMASATNDILLDPIIDQRTGRTLE